MASEIFTESKKPWFFACFNLLDNDDDLPNKNRELNSTRKLLFVRKMRKNGKKLLLGSVSLGLPGLARHVTTNINIFDFNILFFLLNIIWKFVRKPFPIV